jgi:hypothetical protein
VRNMRQNIAHEMHLAALLSSPEYN